MKSLRCPSHRGLEGIVAAATFAGGHCRRILRIAAGGAQQLIYDVPTIEGIVAAATIAGGGPVAAAPSAPTPPSSSAYCCSSRHHASSIRAGTTTTRAPRGERVDVPDRADNFAARAPIYVCASRVRPQSPRRARRRPLDLSLLLLLTSPRQLNRSRCVDHESSTEPRGNRRS